MGDVSPINEADLLTYMHHCRELELAGERQSYQIGPFTTLVMVGALQLAMRHPSMTAEQLAQIGQIIEGFRPWFAGTLGEQMIDLGNLPAFDRESHSGHNHVSPGG